MTIRNRIREISKTSDAGSTMAAVLMVIMVVMSIGVASLQTAMHSNDVSSVDRERLQTVQAAEAGVNESIRALQEGTRTCDSVVSADSAAGTVLRDGSEIVGKFRTQISPSADPGLCVIDSWGYAPTGGTRALRHIEVQVKLVPNNGFPYTIMAEGDNGGADAGKVMVKNNGEVQGGIYAEVLDSSKNNFDTESIVTPDSIVTKNNGVFNGTLWAGGNITFGSNTNVGGSVLAAGSKSGTQGSITLNDGYVGQDARAKGAISGSTNVQGTVKQNDGTVPVPPTLAKPTFAWNAANYSPAPTERVASGTNSITSILNTNRNSLSGVYHATNTDTVTIPDNAIVAGDLTIVAEGKIVLGNKLTASGGPWKVVLIAKDPSATSIDDSNNAFQSDLTNIDLLLYSLGGVNFDKRVDMKGAVYASLIDAKNGCDVRHSTALASYTPPGFTFTNSGASSYSAVPTLWREIVPGAPPA